jgi:DNA-directed RNA polymerase specialized sigma24 family protein
MDPRREAKPSPRFLLNSVDLLGREIDPAVLSVAQEIAPRAVSHGEKLLGDPALAISLFEEAAATVSKTTKQKAASGKPGIRDMRGYLFRAYLRRISVERKAYLALDDTTEEDWQKHAQQTDVSGIERQILVKELLESCDTLTREILYRKLEGCTGKEIEKFCGIPVNAANLRFSKALRRLQRAVRARGR